MADEHALCAAVLHELVAEPAFAGSRVRHDADDAALAGARPLERGFEGAELGVAPHELREAAGARRVEPRARLADPLELVYAHRLRDALERRGAEVAQREPAGDEPRGAVGDADGARLGERFHALREAHGVALRGVVHAQVVADLPDHHLARVDPHAHGEAQAPRDAQLVAPAAQRVAQMQRRVARALRVILVRDRRAEQRHDAVARVLVDGAFEAVDSVGQDLEEAIQDAVPLLGIDRLRELQRALHVREEHRDLLALPLEGAPGGQDLVGEVLGGIGLG